MRCSILVENSPQVNNSPKSLLNCQLTILKTFALWDFPHHSNSQLTKKKKKAPPFCRTVIGKNRVFLSSIEIGMNKTTRLSKLSNSFIEKNKRKRSDNSKILILNLIQTNKQKQFQKSKQKRSIL